MGAEVAMVWKASFAMIVALGLVACVGSRQPAGTAGLRVAPDIAARRTQFAPMKLEADLASLSREDRAALEHLVAAAKLMDAAFHRQVWSGNAEFAPRVASLDGPEAGVVQRGGIDVDPADHPVALADRIDAPHGLGDEGVVVAGVLPVHEDEALVPAPNTVLLIVTMPAAESSDTPFTVDCRLQVADSPGIAYPSALSTRAEYRQDRLPAFGMNTKSLPRTSILSGSPRGTSTST